jgi:F0F1-type ATP synthase assembly protein I
MYPDTSTIAVGGVATGAALGYLVDLVVGNKQTP